MIYIQCSKQIYNLCGVLYKIISILSLMSYHLTGICIHLFAFFFYELKKLIFASVFLNA